MIVHRFGAARNHELHIKHFFHAINKARGKKVFAEAQSIAAIFRGDFARHFRAKKKSVQIC
jgi:hypothetical protein